MRATFAPGGDGGLESDPALEPSEVGGHTLLQRRLALYGKVLVGQSILYWLIYAIIWGPTVGFTRSLGHIASWDVVLLTAIYSLYWIIARGRPRSAPVLLALDIGGSLAIGIDNVFLMLGDLGTISGVFENLIGFICILFFRSPSPYADRLGKRGRAQLLRWWASSNANIRVLPDDVAREFRTRGPQSRRCVS